MDNKTSVNTQGSRLREGLLPTVFDRLFLTVSNLICAGKEKDGKVMKQLVTTLECEPLNVGDKDLPEQCDILLSNTNDQPAEGKFIHKGLILTTIFLCLSVAAGSLLWFTEIYDNAILNLVSIRNDIDMVFESWKAPPTRPLLSVYIFNYTNHEAVMEGREYPKVKELGPYVFREKLERVNVTFNDNGTVSYQESRTIVFVPELSYSSLDKVIRVPNVPLITFLHKTEELDYLVQKLASVVIVKFDGQPFLNVTIHDFLWGYEDRFFSLIKTLKNVFDSSDQKPFGFLAKRRGVSPDVITVNTGYGNLNSIGAITRWNGKSRIGAWGNTSCDDINGRDGSIFPVKRAQRHETFHIYSNSMCRTIPLVYSKSTKSKDGFPVFEYEFSRHMFNYSEKFQENMCYKYQNEFPTDGIFNTAPCNDAPMYASFPHFLHGSSTLQKNIIGLNPSEEKHKSYFQINEKLGVPMLVNTRFQLSIMLKKSNFIHHTSSLKEDLILPMGWLDYNTGNLPPHLVNVVYHLTYTTHIIKELLKWMFLLMALVCTCILCHQMQTIKNYGYLSKLDWN